MAYAKAVVAALLGSVLLGAASGVAEVFRAAVSSLRPGDKQVIYAMGVSVAMNCAAFFVLVLVPLSVVLLLILRRLRRSAPTTAGRNE